MSEKNTNSAASGDTAFPAMIQRVLQGVVIEAPTKFKPGHKLTFDEALFCSTQHMAAVRSAFEDQARAMKDPDRVDDTGKKIGAATDVQIQTAFTAYFENYVWSPRGDSTPVDPLDAEIRKVARTELTIGLKRAERSWPDGKEAREQLLSGYIAKHRDRLSKIAKKNLDSIPSLSEDFLAEIDKASAASARA